MIELLQNSSQYLQILNYLKRFLYRREEDESVISEQEEGQLGAVKVGVNPLKLTTSSSSEPVMMK